MMVSTLSYYNDDDDKNMRKINTVLFHINKNFKIFYIIYHKVLVKMP